MDKRKREAFSPPALGGSSLLTVFAVLALTVFALLSLSTVRADGRLGDASAAAVAGYYEADCRAQEVLARLRAGERPEGCNLAEESDGAYSYAVAISDTQELQVRVRTDDAGGYAVLRWEAAPVGDWDYDDSLHVWDGES